MSTFDSDDLETTGYFLPEDSQNRKGVRENCARTMRSVNCP
jgi:hypothetical protein